MAQTSLSVVFTPSHLADLLEMLSPQQVPKALVSAINKTLGKVRTQEKKAIGDEVNLKAGAIGELISVHKATSTTLAGAIRVKRRKVPLIEYGARQTKQGVSVAVRKGKGRELQIRYFIAVMPTGHIGVFKRRAGAKAKLVDIENGRKVYHGLKIDEVFGPTAVGVLAGVPGILQRLQQFANVDLGRQVLSQIARFTKAPRSTPT